jgi:hypothetical protein
MLLAGISRQDLLDAISLKQTLELALLSAIASLFTLTFHTGLPSPGYAPYRTTAIGPVPWFFRVN